MIKIREREQCLSSLVGLCIGNFQNKKATPVTVDTFQEKMIIIVRELYRRNVLTINMYIIHHH